MIKLDKITFNRKTGRYHSEFGGFLSRLDILNVIDRERKLLNNKIQKYYSQFEKDKNLSSFERKTIEEIKKSTIRIGLLGYGGLQNFNQDKESNSRGIEAQLKNNLNILYKQVTNIDKSAKTEKQLRDGFQRLSRRLVSNFSAIELEQRIKDQKHSLGKRILDSNANHCRQCPSYATFDFIDISKIVPIGYACDCGGYCKCRIVTKKAKQQEINMIQ